MKKLFVLLFTVSLVFAQGLFESAQSKTFNYALSGEIRSGLLAGGATDSLHTKDLFSRLDIGLKAEAGRRAYAFAELRLRHHRLSGKDTLEINLREAYVDLGFGPFRTRLGKQIEIWGRADAFSSLDNLSPKDLRRVYGDPGDMRMGNFFLNSSVRLGMSSSLQGIWIPVYRANIIPAGLFEMPDNVRYGGILTPDAVLKNSGGALRLDLATSEYDAGFSYLNAYALQPGFSAEMQVHSPTDIRYRFYQKPWRQQVVGFDAAFTADAWSFRFEGSYMLPDSAGDQIHIPEKEVQWTLGLDRAWGPLRILVEYNGKYIPAFSELALPSDPALLMDYRLLTYKRLFFSQQDKVRHGVFIRPSLTLFHDTFEIEAPFLYYFTGSEYMFSPSISFEPADALRIRLGATVYKGEDNTLFELLSEQYNGLFAEIRISF